MYAIYLRAPAFYDVVPHPPAWMNVTFNRERRAFMAAVDGKGEFAFHTQLREGEDPERTSAAGAAGLFQAAAGARIDATILSCDTWTAGHALVADRFGRGRILLGGDAAHLFTPAGGLGYNTAVEDAVNLGWKLAAAVKGVAGPRLVESYELERRLCSATVTRANAAARRCAPPHSTFTTSCRGAGVVKPHWRTCSRCASDAIRLSKERTRFFRGGAR